MNFSEGGFPYIRVCEDKSVNAQKPIKREFNVLSFLSNNNAEKKQFIKLEIKKPKAMEKVHQVEFNNDETNLDEIRK